VTALIIAWGLADRVAAGGEPFGLTTDPRRVERMLANLIGNAVEHSGRDVRVRPAPTAPHGYVEMADAGPGIPPEHLPRVLERSCKADSARAGAGSGRGLAIALENARLLDGNIRLSSDVQRCSVFWLVLPLGPAGDVSGL
jgi:signal transduction histidine kinase